ncbi:NADP oxidoreductase [Rhizorhabdus dicambivorans]|uniref:NADP oxidoreductase n=2 Tax=Rhizorhabdus dicambivorans TaxID=1850238 RepID=A0A2A4FXJ1_9SPHN|nr:NADP oxidoreductase [Rhizorhabdus dicambivorans]PCE42116.1 NADP oxidoreductase [Rhizorhabdus dicambivorans]
MAPVRVAVIGAGPAGYYAAEALLASETPLVAVDMFDRLPTPWGLVRAGVAPDHPRIKSVSAQFAEIASHPRYRYFGNVELGRDISRDELLARYDAVLYAVGARSERRLGIAGEDLPGSLAASDFVAWYNGHPDHAALAPDLSGTRAVVIGNGNVALDVARMLLLPQGELSQTDTADHAIAAFATSNIREVVILGRRGPAEAAFTTPEIRELADIEGLDVGVDDPALLEQPLPPDTPDIKRIQRNITALAKYGAGRVDGERRMRFRFLRSPLEIGGNGRVESITLGINRLETEGGQTKAVDTGERETIATDLVIRAVGYRGVPLPGVPFDEASATIPNEQGKVTGGEREYVAGWIKRGPSGVIGTNRGDAVETVERLLADFADADSKAAAQDEISGWLRSRCPEMVDHAGWLGIDRHETGLGEPSGRPRVKLVTIDAMLGVARTATSADELQTQD